METNASNITPSDASLSVTAPPTRPPRSTAGPVLLIVLGAILGLIGLGASVGGAGLGIAALTRDDAGFFVADDERLNSATYAITAEDIDVFAEAAEQNWARRLADLAEIRLRVTGSDRPVFVGVGPSGEVDAYLAGVAHDELVDVTDAGRPVYVRRAGREAPALPGEQSFWVTSVQGSGEQELRWEPEPGRWSVVMLTADGTRGVDATVEAAVKFDLLVPLALGLLLGGLVFLGAGTALVIAGGRGLAGPATPITPTGTPGAAGTAGAGLTGDTATVVSPAVVGAGLFSPGTPVRLEGRLDEPLSRWLWLVKWLLAIPHAIVLAFLWIGVVVATIAAGVAILFTGRYPSGLFRYNVGVLRWTWRVQYYATSAIGTDQYPPFTMDPVPSYPARLDIAPPPQLSRWQVLVKSWLFALPHLVIVGLLTGGWVSWEAGDWRFPLAWPGGLLALLVLVAGVLLAVTGRYAQGLFDLVMGLNRWVYRVAAYCLLMTDDYPPFRLDQGPNEARAPIPTPF